MLFLPQKVADGKKDDVRENDKEKRKMYSVNCRNVVHGIFYNDILYVKEFVNKPGKRTAVYVKICHCYQREGKVQCYGDKGYDDGGE